MGFAGFVRVPLVPYGALWRSLGYFGFIWSMQVGLGGRSGSSGSFGCAMGVTGVV